MADLELQHAMEAYYGDIADPLEFLRDDPSFGITRGVVTQLIDREEGAYRPIYWTDVELAKITGKARILADSTQTGQSILTNLVNYVQGTGLAYKFQAKKGVKADAGLTASLQRWLDSFLAENSVIGDAEREYQWRGHRDGETLATLYENAKLNCGVALRFTEPVCLRQPPNPRQIERLIGWDRPSSWTFGVHTDHDDVETIHGYYAQFDVHGNDCLYLPYGMVEHYKRNTDRSAKRGVSDFYAIGDRIEKVDKLGRNMAVGAAAQAAIAWIEENVVGTSQSDVQSFNSGKATSESRSATMRNGTQVRYQREMPPGTIISPSPGRKYISGPMGAERNNGFIEVAQYLLRCIGSRWAMPEYMISGDASNNNMASALVAESPFVKACQREQGFLRASLTRMLWKALAIAAKTQQFGTALEAIERQYEIAIEFPEVASRDPVAMATTAATQITSGYLSLRTAATKAGLDFDHERANIKADKDPKPMDAMPVAGQPVTGDKPADAVDEPAATLNLNGAQITAAANIVAQVSSGELPRDSGIGQLQVLFGLSAAQANAILGSAGTAKPVTANPTSTSESVVESIFRECWGRDE